jgi:hypothetical protein
MVARVFAGQRAPPRDAVNSKDLEKKWEFVNTNWKINWKITNPLTGPAPLTSDM